MKINNIYKSSISLENIDLKHKELVELATEEIKKNNHGEVIPITGKSMIVSFYISDYPVGIIIFRKWNKNELWIDCSYTLPSFRNSGCYTLLYNEIINYAKNTNISKISSGVSIKNKNMLELLLCNKDRTVDFIVFSQEL